MESIYKYPRTRHLEGSRKQQGDEDLKSVPFREIAGKYLVLEEKVDGANCGVSFGQDQKMYLQSRGHFLTGGYGERQKITDRREREEFICYVINAARITPRYL